MHNISHLVARNARKYLHEDAVVTPEDRYSWGELNIEVNQFAHYLRHEHGVESGDRVALVLPNSYAFILSYFAVLRLGAVVVPVNVRLATPELEYILDDSEAKVVITCSLTDEAVKPLTQNGVQGLWLDDPVTMLSGLSQAPVACECDEFSLCCILYTSGTTGRPKGVLFNHKALLGVATMFAVEMEYKPESRLLSMMPYTHSAPLNLQLVAGTLVGCTHVVAPTFEPELMLNLVEQERTTHFFGAPVAYLLTAQHPDIKNRDLSSMRYWVYGGGPMSQTQAERVQAAFGSDQFYCVYGLTEAGPTGTLLMPEEHTDKAGSIGRRAALNTEVRLMNEDGYEVRVGEPGEIEITGEGLMVGYWNNLEATAEALTEDGWLRTGDIAVKDEDGYLWVKDRKKDIIISGGVNVYPREVEDALSQHEAVAEAAVIGVPNEEWGESVQAYVILQQELEQPEEALRAFLTKQIADYKVPRQFKVMAELPRNANGKVLKHKLREQAGA